MTAWGCSRAGIAGRTGAGSGGSQIRPGAVSRASTAAAGYRMRPVEAGDEVIGFAMAVPTDHDNPPSTQLRMLYVLRRHHGSGAGQALLDAVVGSEPCQLWVARENPRAHRFYRRNGFVPDGT